MSIKRQATTELNLENWDQDDPSEHEDMGTFKSASKDILEKRVIRTAKRRTNALAASDETKKSVFSGFGGFNKSQPSSFDFLANLTNGNETTNGTPTNKSDNAAPSKVFLSKPPSMAPYNSGLFSVSASKPAFGVTNTQSSSLFSGTSPNAPSSQSPIATTKTDSNAASSPFKIPTSLNSFDTNKADTSKNNTTNSNSPFGTSNNTNNTLFSTSSPFKMSASTASVSSKLGNDTENKTTDSKDDKKLQYYAKLKGLNESVSDWIKKHVEETPLCILSPIFKDYEKHLKEIQDEYQCSEEPKKSDENKISETKLSPAKSTDSSASNSGPSLFSNSDPKHSIFGSKPAGAASGEKNSGFSFGISTANSSATTTTAGAKFSFGINSASQTTTVTSSPFSLTTNTSGSEGAAPFSFGMGKPFSFSSNIQKSAEQTKETTEEEDEPPKVEFTPVVEENSIFDKRCKIFVKKDGNFVDKGLGTLYLKKIEETGKHQLLVRANTNLGTILINLILTSSIPTQRLGKNNVMMVCIPTPDAKPPPTPILIRVKTSEEADNLLETLNKYKV